MKARSLMIVVAGWGLLGLILPTAPHGASKKKATEVKKWNVVYYDTARPVPYLDQDGKDLIMYANMVRKRPRRFMREFLIPSLAYYIGKQYKRLGAARYTKEGKKAMEDAMREMRERKYKKSGRLFPNKALSAAAAEIAAYQAQAKDRNLPPDKKLIEWIRKQGEFTEPAAVNVQYDVSGGLEILRAMLASDADPNRTARKNILKNTFSDAGFAFAEGKAGKVAVLVLAKKGPGSKARPVYKKSKKKRRGKGKGED